MIYNNTKELVSLNNTKKTLEKRNYMIDCVLYNRKKRSLISALHIFTYIVAQTMVFVTHNKLTRVISNVKHGVCFFVSLILTACAFEADFIALVRFSGINSRYILLVSSFPSMRYSSKKLL